jgi:hypothetical protein
MCHNLSTMSYYSNNNVQEVDPKESILLRILPEAIFCNHVADDYLKRKEIVKLMTIKQLEITFSLKNFFCPEHGTRLLVTHEMLELSDGEDEDEEEDKKGLSSKTIPNQCVDCTMGVIGHYRCERCDNFSSEFFYICDDCERGVCSRSCGLGGTCGPCQDTLCPDCAKKRGWFKCDECEEQRCPCEKHQCQVCTETLCNDCKGGLGWSTCADCQKEQCGCESGHCECCSKSYCLDCRTFDYCSVCDDLKCNSCRTGSFYCETCGDIFCRDCKEQSYLSCARCGIMPWCEEHGVTHQCSVCDDVYCSDCRRVGDLSICCKANDCNTQNQTTT